MSVNKIFLKIVIIAIYLFIISWTFNHIDAWAGIGIFVLGTYIAAKLIFKNNNKNQEK